jgi:Zn-dependent peptidase ImmA (M78 family)
LGHPDEWQGDRVHVDRRISTYYFRDQNSSSGKDRVEVAANGFAAELLMPESLVRFIAGSFIDKSADGMLMDMDIDRLAELFDVSSEAMGYRLHNLKLLG